MGVGITVGAACLFLLVTPTIAFLPFFHNISPATHNDGVVGTFTHTLTGRFYQTTEVEFEIVGDVECLVPGSLSMIGGDTTHLVVEYGTTGRPGQVGVYVHIIVEGGRRLATSERWTIQVATPRGRGVRQQATQYPVLLSARYVPFSILPDQDQDELRQTVVVDLELWDSMGTAPPAGQRDVSTSAVAVPYSSAMESSQVYDMNKVKVVWKVTVNTTHVMTGVITLRHANATGAEVLVEVPIRMVVCDPGEVMCGASCVPGRPCDGYLHCPTGEDEGPGYCSMPASMVRGCQPGDMIDRSTIGDGNCDTGSACPFTQCDGGDCDCTDMTRHGPARSQSMQWLMDNLNPVPTNQELRVRVARALGGVTYDQVDVTTRPGFMSGTMWVTVRLSLPSPRSPMDVVDAVAADSSTLLKEFPNLITATADIPGYGLPRETLTPPWVKWSPTQVIAGEMVEYQVRGIRLHTSVDLKVVRAYHGCQTTGPLYKTSHGSVKLTLATAGEYRVCLLGEGGVWNQILGNLVAVEPRVGEAFDGYQTCKEYLQARQTMACGCYMATGTPPSTVLLDGSTPFRMAGGSGGLRVNYGCCGTGSTDRPQGADWGFCDQMT